MVFFDRKGIFPFRPKPKSHRKGIITFGTFWFRPKQFISAERWVSSETGSFFSSYDAAVSRKNNLLPLHFGRPLKRPKLRPKAFRSCHTPPRLGTRSCPPEPLPTVCCCSDRPSSSSVSRKQRLRRQSSSCVAASSPGTNMGTFVKCR